jgi:chromosome segregation ATPase
MRVATDRLRSGIERDLSQLLEWLDEQRRMDHDRLIQLIRTVELQRDELREQGAALASLRANSGAKPPVEPKTVDGMAPRLAEQLALVERRLDDHVESESRAAQADAALRDRERRTTADLVQQSQNLGRGIESVSGRVQALAEELRHEREARAPFTQALDELSRTQASLASRLASLEQSLRRVTTSLSSVEQASEKQTNELARLDNQVKLQDLRYTREILEIRKVVDEWRARADEQLKPIESVARQLGQLAEQRELVSSKLDGHDQALFEIVGELNRLDSAANADRATMERVAEALEAHLRRWEATGGSIWQLGERLAAIVDDVTVIRAGERNLREELGGLGRRVDRADEESRRLESLLTESAGEIRVVDRDAQTRVDRIEARLDAEVSALSDRANARYQLTSDHLRRVIEELQQQQRELDLGAT